MLPNFTLPIRPIWELTRRNSQYQILPIPLKRVPTLPEVLPDGETQGPSIARDLLAVESILCVAASTEFHSVAEAEGVSAGLAGADVR